MDIIKVNKIEVGKPKDIIEVKTFKDLEEINNKVFSDGIIYDLNGNYYLVGLDIMYILKKK